MKSEKLGILGTALFLTATLVAFGVYLKSDTNQALTFGSLQKTCGPNIVMSSSAGPSTSNW